MKILLILRHAKSSWENGELPDHQRPLNKRGKRDAPRLGKWLREADLVPDVILCSTAVRARSTAKAVAEVSGFGGEIVFVEAIYEDPEAETFYNELSNLPDEVECAMIVGHNPSLEELVEDLTGEYVRLSTAALAQINLPIQSWLVLASGAQGNLVQVWRPKENL
jgi:phosphohistidine phosphatase